MHSVFHPPGKNPFQLPPLPQSHYIPSPSKEISDKSITLTPQKLKHRHEYSIPPEVYTPDQYSIHEDEAASSKPPLPSHVENEDIVRNLQQYLDDIESWNSKQFCEQWPSKDSTVIEDPSQKPSTVSSAMPAKAMTSTTRSSKPKPRASGDNKSFHIKTSFASERNLSADSERSSIIQARLDRFRYGEPKPLEARKKEKAKLPTPSSTPDIRPHASQNGSKYSVGSSRKASTPRLDLPQTKFNDSCFSKISGITTNSQRIPCPKTAEVERRPPRIQDSPEPAETSLSTLNTRLENLLKESKSVISSPRSSVQASVDKSSSFEMRVSSSYDSTKSSELEMSQLRSQNYMQDAEKEIPRRMLWQKENVPHAPFPASPRKIEREDDILHQWRLRRKLEIARENVEKKPGPSYQQSYHSYATDLEIQAEKPLISTPSVRHLYAPSPNQPPQTHGYGPPSVLPQQSHNPNYQNAPPIPPVYQPQPFQVQPHPPPTQHQPGCNCQMIPHTFCPFPSPKKDAGTSPIPFQSPPQSPKQSGMTELVSSETQTGQSLILLQNDSATGYQSKGHPEPLKRSSSEGSFPHTSTPASSVSFHRVKIVQAEPENSPQTSKGSPRARNISPMSSRTEATTVWSSTDHNKKSDDGRSPMSSVKTLDPKFTSDSETYSPTANVVKEVIGSRLFNTSQTPSSTSAVSRLKGKKKGKHENNERPTMADNLNGSYTFSDHSSVKSSQKEEISDSSTESVKSSRIETKSRSAVDTLSEKSHRDGVESDAPSDHSSVKSSKKKKKSGKSSGNGSPKTVPKEVLQQCPTPPVEDDETSSGRSQLSVPDLSTVCKDEDKIKESDFNPEGLFDNLFEDIASDAGDDADSSVLETLRSQKDELVQEFRLLEDLIENEPISSDDETNQ